MTQTNKDDEVAAGTPARERKLWNRPALFRIKHHLARGTNNSSGTYVSDGFFAYS